MQFKSISQHEIYAKNNRINQMHNKMPEKIKVLIQTKAKANCMPCDTKVNIRDYE